MAYQKLFMEDAEKAKYSITSSQQKEIAKLYSDWADDIAKKADYYSKKTTKSAPISELQFRALEKQLRASSEQVSNELSGIVQKNMYLVSDAVAGSVQNWLVNMGYPKDIVSVQMSNVPVDAVNNIITGKIYDTGWSLSQRIWGNNDETLKQIYQIVAGGRAKNESIYDISKKLENYVRPNAAKQWNLVALDGKRIYPKKVDYNAQRLARTLTQHAYQQSFVQATKNNPFVLQYQWIANGSRVCELCQERDGKIYEKDNLPLDHPNGMCVMNPIIEENYVDKLADWVAAPDGTYPEIDEFSKNFGYTPDKPNENAFVFLYGKSDYKTYTSWFKSLDLNAQKWATQLKEDSGLSWSKWYDEYIKSEKAKQTKETELKAQVDAMLYKMKQIPDNGYSGIWFGKTAYLTDYEKYVSSGSLQKKIDYYENMIIKDFVNASKYQALLDSLKQYKKFGDMYLSAKKDYETAKSALEAYKNKGKKKNVVAKIVDKIKGAFKPEQYTAEAKLNAKNFTSKTDADNYHRQYLDGVWSTLSDKEKYGVFEYTRNSNPINKSLSGYHDTWRRYDFLGLGKTDLGHENEWRSFESSKFEKNFGKDGHVDYKMVVQSLTKAIEKSQMQDGVMLVRGSDENGLAGILEGNLFSFDQAKKLVTDGTITEIKTALEGQSFINHAYTSTGIASGTGFTGNVMYEIYAPSGTKAIYAEPQSYFGNTISGEELYEVGKKYSSVGSEAEVILQRGTTFRIVEVEEMKSYYGERNLKIKMEVAEQPDYFDTGLEHTHNNGATSYNK